MSRIDRSRCYTNWGPLSSELEERLAHRFRLHEHGVVSASSGTAALVGAILATAGRATADRPFAILPALTFVATAIAVEQCGYRVHLADVSPADWMLDAAPVRTHPQLDRTGLVVPVAAFGRAVPHAPWQAFREQTGVPVVIDAAAGFEAIGARPAELLSEIPVALSFHATKSFATGEGGCVITTDAALSASVTRCLNFGFHEDRESRSASTNGKMSEYHAAIGLAELDGWTAKERRLARCGRPLQDADARRRPLRSTRRRAGDRVLLRALSKRSSREAACVKDALTGRNVGFRSWYGAGIHGQPHFRDVSRDALPVTDRVAPLVIGLPVAPDLAPSDVARAVAAIELGVSQSR